MWFIFSARGWRKKESIEIPSEIPTLINTWLKFLMKNLEYSREEMAKILALNFKEFDERYFPKKMPVS